MIFGLTYKHANGALTSASLADRQLFELTGHAVEIVDLGEADDVARLTAGLKSGSVSFCFGLQGVGSRLTEVNISLWSRYRVPFLCLHHDSPSCNLYNHFNSSAYVGNLYLFNCFYDIQKNFVQSNQFSAHLPFEMWGPLAYVPKTFTQRSIRISFLKTGKPLKEYEDQLNSLTQPLRDHVWDRLQSVLTDENLDLYRLLADAFTAAGYDYRDYLAVFWGIADWMDNYIRNWRAIRLVEWLKFQPGALIVGNGWDFIDRTSTKAIFRPSIDANRSVEIYSESQFTCNTSPYGTDVVHERVINGLYRQCFVLSDTNSWWDKNFAEIPGLALQSWRDGGFPAFEAALRDPDAAAKADSAAGVSRSQEMFYRGTTVGRMIEAAEHIRVMADASPIATSPMAALEIKD